MEHSDDKPLPPSCSDLPFFSPESAFEATIVFEVIDRLLPKLSLTPFRLEDFCAVLCSSQECGSLLNEIFLAVIRFLLREDRSSPISSDCGPLPDGKETLGVWFHCLDEVTWPEMCRIYVNSRSVGDVPFNVLSSVSTNDFPFVNGEQKLAVLHYLMNALLTIQNIQLCSDPKMPTTAQSTLDAILCDRLIGTDSQNRQYWFISRRLFVVDVAQGHLDHGTCIAYYSSFEHAQYLIGLLATSSKEKDQELSRAFSSWIPTITSDTTMTKTLTQQELVHLCTSQHIETALNFDLAELRNFQGGTGSSIVSQLILFRLGDGASFRRYKNEHALNQRQKQEERQELSRTFCVLPPNSYFDIDWQSMPSLAVAEMRWTPACLADSLRSYLLFLETTIPRSNAFFMPAWLTSPLALRWRRAVELCHSPDHFAMAILIFSSNIRLVSFLPVWYDHGGHTWLKCATLAKPEMKSAETNLQIFGLEDSGGLTVKFSKKVRHSLWKQQGEEYRLTAGGGWIWIRRGRRTIHYSKKCSNLLRLAEKFRQEHMSTPALPLKGSDEIVDVSAALNSRKLFAQVPGSTCPLLDGLLTERLKMLETVKHQQNVIMQLVEPLKQGRKMSDLFPPSILPLPDNLPADIRNLPISVETTVEMLLEMSSKLPPKTNDSVRLHRSTSSRPVKKKPNAPTLAVHRFQARLKAAPNIFVLPSHLLRWMCRRGGLVETCPGFLKDARHTWYGGMAPVPTFQTAWEYRTSLLAVCPSFASFAAIAAQLRFVAAALKFDQFTTAPPFPSSGTKNREVVKARLHSREHRRFEYSVRATTTKDGHAVVSECWLADSCLDFWELRYFHEDLSRRPLSLLSRGHLVVDEGSGKRSQSASPSTAVVQVPSPSKAPNKPLLQELRITQLPSGQVQIKGLNPGQFMVRVVDGSFQLVTLTPTLPTEHAPMTPQRPQRNDSTVASPQVDSRMESTFDKSRLKRELAERTASLRQHIAAKRRYLEQRYGSTVADICSDNKIEPSTVVSKSAVPASLASPTLPLPQSPANVRKRVPEIAETPKDKVAVDVTPPSEMKVGGKKRQIASKESPPIANKSNTPRSKTQSEMESTPAREVKLDQPRVVNEKEMQQQQQKSPPIRADNPNPKANPPVVEVALEKTAAAAVPVSADNKKHRETAQEELYCICRTVYDPSVFYIGCEDCGGWFHGDCVGITEEAAQSLDIYYCDACQVKRGATSPSVKKNEVDVKVDESVTVAESCGPVSPMPSSKKATPSNQPQKSPPAVPLSAPPSELPSSKETAGKAATPVVENARLTRTRGKSLAQQAPISMETEAIIVKPATTELVAAADPPASSSSSGAGNVKAKKSFAKATADSQLSSPERQQPSASSVGDELYCICRTPYDDTEFYIGCDGCGEWYHGACVFVAECEAKWIVNWLCPRCQKNDESKVLLSKDNLWRGIDQLLASLQRHKKSWPFRAPVDRTLYPLYYAVIRRPIDLSLIASRVTERRYATLDQFKFEILLMFDNCRRFNPPESKFFHCADEIQKFFLERYRALLQENGIACPIGKASHT